MPVFRIPQEHVFPDPALAEPSGLLGVYGDLDPARVILAYNLGIFPWYSEGEPICWYSPDPRMVLDPEAFTVPRSLGKIVRRGDYRITMDTCFEQVMRACGEAPRPGQKGTWITEDMLESYLTIHQAGLAHSIEAWSGETLVGGLYGIEMGGVFAGESMFARAPDASKVAFAWFVRQFQRWGGALIDCQMHTPHLARFGATLVPRSAYLQALSDHRDRRLTSDRWCFDVDFHYDGR